MTGTYHGYTLGDNAFFANTEADAIQEFSKRAGCEVRKCVYPVFGIRVYYISDHGHLFSLIRDDSKHIFVGYGPAKAKIRKDREIKKQGVVYGVKSYKNGRDTTIAAERLVYCTFVLGVWKDDVELRFKDGDKYNVCLENIEEPHYETNPIWAKHMAEEAAIYKRDFNKVVDCVRWLTKIRWDEAEDCAQETFMWLTSGERTMPEYFTGAWIFWAKTYALHVIRDNIKTRILQDWEGSSTDRQVEMDILGMVKNEKYRDMIQMKLHGYTNVEIGQKYGTSDKCVATMVGYALDKLRKTFSNDFHALGIKYEKSGNGRVLV